jgi:hypothetical protein
MEEFMVGYTIKSPILTANPGDRIAKEPQTIEEKAKQIAVDKYDITGTHIKVPAYFIVNYPDGQTKALHHVRDAKAISDVIRQMNLAEENSSPTTTLKGTNQSGLISIMVIFTLGLLLMTSVIMIGIF